jgi:hypothetical protein
MEQTIARYRAQLRNSPDAEPIQVLARTQGGKGVVATLNQREVPDAALFEGAGVSIGSASGSSSTAPDLDTKQRAISARIA